MAGLGTVLLTMIFAIPVVAIIGGITAGILKTRGQQRILELAHRERIAAIEKGIDPAKLPPLPPFPPPPDLSALFLTPRQADLKQAQGFLLTGLILVAIGLGLSTMLVILETQKAWASGLIPIFLGVALLVCAAIVRKGVPPESQGPTS
jgi:hypothetical protein